ncbi:MAG: glucose-6-phosphate isomerase [Bacteroidota bacterium]|nr:glucose-6-phosphate isomerase [Bacteroidota bacterium]
MIDLKVDFSNILGFVDKNKVDALQAELNLSHQKVLNKTGEGNDFLGWVDLPESLEESLLQSIEKDAARISKIADIFVVIGIGGSYLGARAVNEALSHQFSHFLRSEKRQHPHIVFAGNNLSEDYLADLIDVLDQKDYAMAVISKSGTTTEPAIAFRILREHIEKKYGKEEARNRIIAITDKEKGVLKKLSLDEGYSSYVVPDDIGGRYSVLTPVGLLPIAVAGFDIRKMILGAKAMRKVCIANAAISSNPAASYAAARTALYRNGKTTEIMVGYQPSLVFFVEWWKQLYGESEGKQNRGIFPAGVTFTADLHSMGQYIQQGLRILFETVISVEKPRRYLSVPMDKENLDGLNFTAGKRISEVNRQAELGTLLAHVDGGVPNIIVNVPVIDENIIGQLVYFFEFACALSGYMLEVNPFDQPGVEAYKKNMFALLGKPGYEKQAAELKARL